MATANTKKAPAKKNAPLKDDAPESANTLPALLIRMNQMSGSLGASFVLTPMKGDKTLITATAPGTSSEARLPMAIPGLTEARGFPVQSFLDAVLKRPKLQYKVDDFTLKIKGVRYEAAVIGTEVTGIARPETIENPSVDLKFTADLIAAMKEGLEKVRISKTLDAMPDVTVHFSFRKKGLLIAAFDRSQMAFYKAANETGFVFELTLPLPRAEALLKNMQPESELKANDSLVWVKGLGITFSSALPSEDASHGIPIERVLERAKVLDGTSLARKVTFKKEDLVAFIANTGSIRKSSALLTFAVGADGVTELELSADGNVVKSKIQSKGKKAFRFLLDINYVNALIAKSEEFIELELDDAMLIYKSDDLIYASMLSAEKSTDEPEEDAGDLEEE